MPTIKLEDLAGQSVKPGDTVSFTVKAVNDDTVELDYSAPEVEETEEKPEMEMDATSLRQKMVSKHGETDSEGY